MSPYLKFFNSSSGSTIEGSVASVQHRPMISSSKVFSNFMQGGFGVAGIHQYEFKFRLQRVKRLRKEAKSLNLQFVAA